MTVENKIAEKLTEKHQSALLIGTRDSQISLQTVEEYLSELAELADVLDISVTARKVVLLRQIHPKFYIGSGKAEEIARFIRENEIDLAIFDTDLGPAQQKNLEDIFQCQVLDRQEIILDIFAKRAWTREAVLQVELAKYQYYLPRLIGAWSHLSRQRGGNTGARGDGEKQIEYDRRYIKRRIQEMSEDLSVVKQQRDVQRKSRIRNNIPLSAIIGYTNAGKSTLLNVLTDSNVLAEDQLFATLDPSTRRCRLPGHHELLLTDTVGFVRNLPHTLIDAFKATLEEAMIADFLLIILDVSNPQVVSQWQTTLTVLKELNASDKPRIVVFNKCDKPCDPVILSQLRAEIPDPVMISAATGYGLEDLKNRLICQIDQNLLMFDIDVPVGRYDVISMLHSKARIFSESYTDDGMFHAVAGIQPQNKCLFEDYVGSRMFLSKEQLRK